MPPFSIWIPFIAWPYCLSRTLISDPPFPDFTPLTSYSLLPIPDCPPLPLHPTPSPHPCDLLSSILAGGRYWSNTGNGFVQLTVIYQAFRFSIACNLCKGYRWDRDLSSHGLNYESLQSRGQFYSFQMRGSGALSWKYSWGGDGCLESDHNSSPRSHARRPLNRCGIRESAKQMNMRCSVCRRREKRHAGPSLRKWMGDKAFNVMMLVKVFV